MYVGLQNLKYELTLYFLPALPPCVISLVFTTSNGVVTAPVSMPATEPIAADLKLFDLAVFASFAKHGSP